MASYQDSAVILIADDDPVCRLFCLQALATADTQLSDVADGQSAIQFATQQRPYLMLIDQHLPDLEGSDAIREIIRLWPAAKTDCVFIGMTADHSSAVHKGMKNAGCVNTLEKPFDLLTLRSCVGAYSPNSSQFPDLTGKPTSDSLRISESDLHLPTISKLQTAFRAELLQQMRNLDSALQSIKHAEARPILHTLAGAAAMSGFYCFKTSCQELERLLAQNGNCSMLAELYLDIIDQAQLILDQASVSSTGASVSSTGD
jgi:CheY-like chemotaxis protein